jgi:hypothetical protein
LKKLLESEWAKKAGGPRQAMGIIDTVLNRQASGHWGSTVADVVNARKQFSLINGPPAWNEGWRSVEGYPWSRVTQTTSDFVDQYLIERANGAPSSIGSHLNYANPAHSDAKNLSWIRKLDGPRLGSRDSVHWHGTVPGLQQYRPQPYTIILPPSLTKR